MQDVKFEKIPSGIFDKVESNKERFVEKFIDELEELFPDTVKDGKVDFQALLERFGEYEDRDERYEMTWVGKSKARQEAFEDIVGRTLKYVEEDSKNPETTQNLYIEGDNLEVLKLLRNSYYGKIKMIYIDPPYNTGKDFVYKDNFTLSKEEYDKLKGHVDEYGERLVKNSADSGRYHSDWLNMMYPRLQVAKDLLTDDGVIFISIDDNEVHNLRKICDEIFGEENFVGKLIWKTKFGGGNDSKTIVNESEYILVYMRNIDKNTGFRGKSDYTKYKYQDKYVETRGRYTLEALYRSSIRYSESLFYPIEAPDGSLIYPNDSNPDSNRHIWRWSRDTFEKKKKEGRVEFKKMKDGWRVYSKQYELLKDDGTPRFTPFRQNIFDIPGRRGTEEISKSMGYNLSFNNPKPTELLVRILNTQFDKNCIILDFFSGSATTAQAVMDLNAEDGGNRKFIMVQLPEPTDEKSAAYKEGYKNICEIGKERIRRAGDKILEENKDKEGIENLDTGFKVFRVEDTNFRRIKEVESEDLEIKYRSLSPKEQEDFNPHFTDIDVVYELMLRRQDIELTEEVKKLDYIGDRTYIVGDTMLVCLEEEVTEDMIEKIGNIDLDLSWIILRDSAFDDKCEWKINAANKLRSIVKASKHKNQKIYWI